MHMRLDTNLRLDTYRNREPFSFVGRDLKNSFEELMPNQLGSSLNLVFVVGHLALL
jgi:hypothetical protein